MLLLFVMSTGLLGCPRPEPLLDMQVAELALYEGSADITVEPGETLALVIQALNAAERGIDGVEVELLIPQDGPYKALTPTPDERGIASNETESTRINGASLRGVASFTIMVAEDAHAGSSTIWMTAASRVLDDDETTGDDDDEASSSSAEVVTLPISVEIVDPDETTG